MSLDRTLRFLYFNPKSKVYFGSQKNLFAAAKKLQKNIKFNDVRAWLHQQATYTLHKPVKYRFPRNRVVATSIDSDWQIDLIDLRRIQKHNNGFAYILIAIDVLSKFGFAAPIKSKKPEHVLVGLRKILKSGRRPAKVQTDKGREFENATVKSFFHSNFIQHFVSQNPDTKCSVVERYIRSVKTVLWKFFTQKQTLHYLKILPRIIQLLNTREHRSIKMAPKDVNVSNETQVWETLYGPKKPLSATVFNFSVGDIVRITTERSVFKKGYRPNFSKELFVVEKRIPRQPPVYQLKDLEGEPIIGHFYEHELVQYTGKKNL